MTSKLSISNGMLSCDLSRRSNFQSYWRTTVCQKSAVADSLLCSEAAQSSLQKLAFKSAVASKGLMIKMNIKRPQIFVFGFYQDKMAINYCITTVQTKPCFTSCAAGNHKNTAGQNQPKKIS